MSTTGVAGATAVKPTATGRAVSVIDAARVAMLVLAPMVAQGVLLRRRRLALLAAAWNVDGRALGTLGRLRDRYGSQPLRLTLPGRTLVIPLDPADVATVLAGTPDPFRADSREKRAALNHFEPQAVLVSAGALREQRRTLNERVLQTDQPVHRHGEHFTRVIADELAALEGSTSPLGWDAFNDVWQRIVRRVVLGDQAANDTAVTEMLVRLRSHGNWAYLRPRN